MQDADTPPPTGVLPAWYTELPAEARSEDFHQKVGAAEIFLCERSTQHLIISFGHADDTDHPELDWPAWTDRLARTKDWSHLAILAPKGSWFRDAPLIDTLQQLRDLGFFKRFKNVTLFGATTKGGGFAALAFAPLCPNAVVVAFDPQSTLRAASVPWEDRFDAQPAAHWSLPFSDVTRALTKTKRAYVAFDPFDRRDAKHVARLPAKRITALKAFGLGDDIGVALKRMGLLDDILIAAVAGTLEPAQWYKHLRQRRDLYLYRRGMERHLEARGRGALSAAFVTAFRRRNRLRKAEAEQQAAAAPEAMPKPPPKAPTLPNAPSSPALAGRRYPRTQGNVWGLRDEPTGFRYLSDQYEGQVMGFEECNEITLGETHPLAIGMAAFGHCAGLPRPLPEDFRYHVVDADLTGRIPPYQAKSHGVTAQRLAAQHRHAYRTILALSVPQSGITAKEALPDSPLYEALLQRIETARTALQGWNKSFHLDRIALSLLAGSPDTTLADAVHHYGTLAQALRHDAAQAAGQASFPHIVVSQSAGTATDGRSEVILAEGQLDIAHPALGIIVATPTYPYPLMDGMPATLEPTAQMQVDELEAIAVATVQNNEHWYCPSLRQAFGHKRTVIVDFAALSDLVLEDGLHGLALHCEGDAPNVTEVQVKGTQAKLTLDSDLPSGDVHVTYAWGQHTRQPDANRTANRGALRDSWAQDSVMQPGQTLHRYALSGRVRIMPSDLARGRG